MPVNIHVIQHGIDIFMGIGVSGLLHRHVVFNTTHTEAVE